MRLRPWSADFGSQLVTGVVLRARLIGGVRRERSVVCEQVAIEELDLGSDGLFVSR